MSKDIFEINMYATETTVAFNRTSWFLDLQIHSKNETDSNLPSSLEMVFLLESGSFIFVPNLLNKPMITQMFNACNEDQHDKSKHQDSCLSQINLQFHLDKRLFCFLFLNY